jgi:dihydrofolate reductase
MRRVRYGGAISLDGYIAGPNGEADWILMDPDLDFAAMFAQYDTLLIGRKTFTAMLAGGWESSSMPEMEVYVFSTTLKQEDYPDLTIVNEGAVELVRGLRETPGKDIALFGGAALFRSLHEAGLVDTVEVSLNPVMLGAGISLMPPPYGPVQLRLTRHRVLPTTGTVSLEYDIVSRR